MIKEVSKSYTKDDVINCLIEDERIKKDSFSIKTEIINLKFKTKRLIV